MVDATFSELYHADGASNGYDLLNQLTEFQRGELSDTNMDDIPDTVSTASRSQSWDFDALGNFDNQTTDATGQSRSHNKQNQITSIQNQTTPTYDANGNMTGDETGRDLVYDAWNRLVEVEDDQDVTLVAYSHDALRRRVAEDDGDLRDLYYSSQWQVLEERLEGDTDIQYVWSPVYIDAMVLRDRDTDGNGSLDERFYVQQDGNYNVTAIVDSSGDVQERYIEDAYGTVTFLDEDWSTLAGSACAWVYLHQGGRLQLVTGLYHFRKREYPPTLGRWNRVDPLRFSAGDWNLYRAYGCNPAIFTDPQGTSIVGDPVDIWGRPLTGRGYACWWASCKTCCLGVGINVLVQLYWNSVDGTDEANGGNAFRHCLATCQSVKACRRTCAVVFWDGREQGGDITNQMDLANNRVGYRCAGTGASCWECCMYAWGNGALTCIREVNGKPRLVPCPGDYHER